MRTLSLMEQGVALAVDGELFSIERAGKVIQQVRMGEVDEVLVYGNVSLTPSAVAAILRRGIDAVFLTARGRYRGRLVGLTSKSVELRVAQYERLQQPAVASAAARGIVVGKIAGQRQVLLRAQREHRREGLAEPIAELRMLTGTVSATESIDTLRGLEGRAAAVYFGALGLCIRNPSFGFTRRSRRPPADPVNAMLSFGYTLLAITVEAAVLRAGFDPLLGAFHRPEHGRPSLVLDVMEEFRPSLVDALVLRLVNRREVAPEDFERAPDDSGDPFEGAGEDAGDAAVVPDEDEIRRRASGIWLSESGRRVFFRAWGRRLRDTHFYPPLAKRFTSEEIIQHQVYALARLVRGEASSYEAFVPR
jgi:CRISPR-associated protein Cas1